MIESVLFRNRWPRNIRSALEITALLIFISFVIVEVSSYFNNAIALAIGIGIMTGAVVHIVSYSTQVLKERREALEELYLIGLKICNKLKFLKRIGENEPDPERLIQSFRSVFADVDRMTILLGRVWFIGGTKNDWIYSRIVSPIYDLRAVEVNIERHDMLNSPVYVHLYVIREFRNKWFDSHGKSKVIEDLEENLEELRKLVNGLQF